MLNRETILLKEILLFNNERLCLTSTIIQEVLQGVKSEKEFYEKKRILESFNFLDKFWYESSVLAAKRYIDLKKERITIKKMDDV